MVGASQWSSRVARSGGVKWGWIMLGWVLAWPNMATAEGAEMDSAELDSGVMDLDLLRSDPPRPGYWGTIEQGQKSGFDSDQVWKNISLNYLTMVSGPTFQGDSISKGEYFTMKNFLGAGYRLGETVTLSGNAYWSVRGASQFPTQFHDPFFRLADSSVWSGDGWNLYLDGRLHLPLSTASLISGLNLGIQSVQSLSYTVPQSRLAFGISSSIRYNMMNPMGFGSVLDLYLGPNAFYQLAPNLGFNLLSEAQWSHLYQRGRSDWALPSFDFEPGLAWDILPNLSFNPYVHVPVGGKSSWIPTYAGFLLNWTLL